MKDRFLKKLKSTKGETISETLVSTLIAAIAMILFSSMVIASRNVIENSKKTINDHYEWITKMAFKDSVKTEDADLEFTVPLVHSDTSVPVKLYYSQPSGGTETNGIQVVSYDKPKAGW